MSSRFETENNDEIKVVIEEEIARHKEKIEQMEEQERKEKHDLVQLYVLKEIKKGHINLAAAEEEGKQFNEKRKEYEKWLENHEAGKDLLKAELQELQEWLLRINHYEK